MIAGIVESAGDHGITSGSRSRLSTEDRRTKCRPGAGGADRTNAPKYSPPQDGYLGG